MKTVTAYRYAPITDSAGFIELPIAKVARGLVAWRKQQGRVRRRRVAMAFPGSIESLLPITVDDIRRELLVEHGGWTAYFGNSPGGTDEGPVGYLATALQCRTVFVQSIPQTTARLGAVAFAMFGPEQTEWLNVVRQVQRWNVGTRWRFDASGEPQPFEEVEAYDAKRTPDRFTPDMLERYCGALGIHPFDDSAYGRAVLVETTRDFAVDELTLQQTRERFGIAAGDDLR